jgi:hypothetical protein
MCVHRMRTIGNPSSSVAITRSHRPRVVSDAIPQSMTVHPSQPLNLSRSSHRLMWSSANGSGLRIQ